MPSKNNLSALKAARPTVLPEAGAEAKPPKQVGRRAKPEGEKRSYRVLLSLTPAEGARLSEKAGLAGDATYLYAKLKEHGIID